ncbi:MAG: GDP-mannose 4,6-dehydratase, partial [Flavisolibacter sp.]|nr:GDP-mannose 4,6-dehydratase [Flavisolibacter sp.]
MRILVTGGAGFIGANLVKDLLDTEQVEKVVVLDNLATGSLKNIEEFAPNKKFSFIQGDIRNYETCLNA